MITDENPVKIPDFLLLKKALEEVGKLQAEIDHLSHINNVAKRKIAQLTEQVDQYRRAASEARVTSGMTKLREELKTVKIQKHKALQENQELRLKIERLSQHG